MRRPDSAHRFALAIEPESHEVSLAASPAAQHAAPGAMLPTRSAAALRTGSGVAVYAHRADPALMAPEARMAELGAIFATGFRRHLLSLQKSLAGSRDLEAQCDHEQ